MYTNRELFFPIKIILGFLIFTEVLYIVGPIDYNAKNAVLMYLFLAICNFAMYKGYKEGIRDSPITRFDISITKISVFLLIALFLKFYELTYIWSGHGIEVSFSSFRNALLDPGKAYYSEVYGSFGGSGTIRLLVSPFTWAAIPFGVLYWKELKPFYRLIVVLIVIIELSVWLGIGVRKGIFDLLIIIPAIIIAKNVKLLDNQRMARRLALAMLIFCIAFLAYFVFSNMYRGGKDMSNFADMFNRQSKNIYDKYLPSWLVLSFISIEDYLCQGYDALSKALNYGILTPVPFSSNWFTIGVAKMFGNDAMQGTYLSLLTKDGIDPFINWHTIYVWLANEFTFIGVPFIIYGIGYFLAQTWKDAIYKMNPFAYPLLALFLIMGFYSYANNQVMSSSFVPFLFWFLLYQLTKRRVKLCYIPK